MSVPFGYYDDGDRRRKYHSSGTAEKEHYKLLLSLLSDIQDAFCKFMLSLQEFYSKCFLQIYAVIARILFKMRITNLCCHCKKFIQKMHIAELCCHCKNFIQNAYFKVMLSLQKFYLKCILQNYAVIARILCQTRIANLRCHCKNFVYTIHCNHSLGFFFKMMQQALNNKPSAVPQ